MAEREHSIYFDPGKCVGCVACAQACPTHAVRVRDGLARLKPELCIDCGACIRACPYDAARARTSTPADLRRFKYTVAIPSMTFYAQFGREVMPEQVLHALTHVGFDSFYDMSWMVEMVAGATDVILSEGRGPWPQISVTCPAIVRLIQIRYPDLLAHLVPLETPRELAAKVLRRKLAADLRLPPEDIGIFFITQCTAIMNSILAPVGLEQSYLDGALGMNDLFGPVLKAITRDHHAGGRHGASGGGEPVSRAGLMWAMSGGEISGMRNNNTMTVSGVQEVMEIFDRVESGKYQGVDFVEAYICPGGCVSGCLAIEGRHVAQRTVQRIARRLEGQAGVKEEKIRTLLHDHFFALEDEIRARPVQPIPRDLRQAIAWKRERAALLDRLPHKDCGACGAPDCETHAEDCLAGESSEDGCVFVRIANLEKSLAQAGGNE